MSRPRVPRHERIRQGVQVSSSGCWLWTGHLDKDGYGRVSVTTARGVYRTIGAHRFSYETFIGPVPDGMTLDHLCHSVLAGQCRGACEHRRCVHPLHVEPVTHAVNRFRSRQIACLREGHVGAWKFRADGGRFCGQCRRDYDARQLVGVA